MRRLLRVAVAALLVTTGPGACKYADEAPDAAGAAAGKPPASSPASGPASAPASAPATSTPEKVGYAFVTAMGKGDWAGGEKLLSPELLKQLSIDKIHEAWDKSFGDAGTYQAIGATQVFDKKTVIYVRVRVALTKGSLEVLLGFAPGGSKINTVNIHAAVPAGTYDPPAYVDGTKFEARDVAVGRDAMALPGVMTVPKTGGPFPAVVLVHGSGGGDMDESASGSRPFRDIAEGLSSRGVVVLRYDKRTYGTNLLALNVPIPDLTVKEEYFDDLANAIDLLHKMPFVDQKRIYVLGHSEGGWLVPWFMKLHPDLKGGILLAGHARPFQDLLISQTQYQAHLMFGDKISPLAQSQLDEIKKVVERSHDPMLAKDTPAKDLPFGSAAAYWLFLQKYDAVATAKADPRPLLILQGHRDYQVTDSEDIPLWKAGLGDRKNVDFHIYPKLNHLFFAGEGQITPSEYLKLGHVDAPVIDDLTAFLTQP